MNLTLAVISVMFTETKNKENSQTKQLSKA